MMHDRAGGESLPYTHEFLSHILGANRKSVTLAAQSMQTAVYQAIMPRFAFDRRSLAPGRYTLSVDLNTDRPDVTQATLLRAPPQHAETLVIIPVPGS